MCSVYWPLPGVAVAQASPASLAQNAAIVATKMGSRPPDALILSLHRLMLGRSLTSRGGFGWDEMARMGGLMC